MAEQFADINDLVSTLPGASQYLTKSQSFQNKLNTSKNKVSQLRFPANVENEGNGNVVRFNISMPSESQYIEEGHIQVMKGADGKVQTSTFRSGGFRGSLGSKLSRQYSRISTQIDLYMPPNVVSSYQANWQSTELGMAGKAFDGLTGIYNADSMTKEVWNYLRANAAESAKATVADTITDIFRINVKDLEQLYTTAVDNPYMEMIYKNVSNRQFSFNFKFIPRNATEQATIKEICKQFVFHQAPEFKSENNNVFMLFPSEFDITFIHKNAENPWLFKISTCALTNVTVNHSPDGQFTSHADGSPFATELTLSFIELPILTKEDHERGY